MCGRSRCCAGVFAGCCRPWNVFQRTVYVLVLVNLFLTTSCAGFLCVQWGNLYFARYVALEVINILIAVIFVNAFGQLFAYLGASKANRWMLALMQAVMLMAFCLTLAAAWIGFCGGQSITDDVGEFYTEMEKNNNHEYFEQFLMCCGWQVVSARCLSVSNSTCQDVTLGILEDVGLRTGTWSIVMMTFQLGELLLVFLVMACFTGFDWMRLLHGERIDELLPD